jgi:hypothetical protein
MLKRKFNLLLSLFLNRPLSPNWYEKRQLSDGKNNCEIERRIPLKPEKKNIIKSLKIFSIEEDVKTNPKKAFLESRWRQQQQQQQQTATTTKTNNSLCSKDRENSELFFLLFFGEIFHKVSEVTNVESFFSFFFCFNSSKFVKSVLQLYASHAFKSSSRKVAKKKISNIKKRLLTSGLPYFR